MADSMRPRVRQTAQNIQYTYNLNRRIHDIKTYPIPSPQGASIILYGHEHGVTIVWRGGRRLKPAKPQSDPAGANKTNGAGGTADDAVMLLDSDDEDLSASTPAYIDKPEFEEEGAGNAAGFAEVVQTLDLALGTDALHLAVLPLAPHAAGDSEDDATILSEKMVFAVTCASSNVYLLTLPLTPPSHDSKQRPELRADLLAGVAGKGKWGETLVSLSGQSRHADGITMTLIRDASTASAPQAKNNTRVVIAAHSKEAAGTLRFWDVPVNRSADQGPIEPFQTASLPAALTGISFNPNPSRSTQLLAIASPQAVRIYDFAVPSIQQDDLSEGPWPTHGSWLLSLYPPFAGGPVSTCSRKPIIGASWISHGRAILTLLADGQWGIWDVEGAGPLGNGESTSLFGKYNTGVRGAALSAFSVSGYLEGTSPLLNASPHKNGPGGHDHPSGSRRDPLLAMLSGGPERLAAVNGGIEVVQLPSTRSLVTGDESVVLWIGGSDTLVCVIPAVVKFWDTQVRRSAGGGVNLYSGAQPSRIVRLTELNAGLLGERCCGVGAVSRQWRKPTLSRDNDSEGVGESTGLPVEVLVRGDSRLVVVQDCQDVDTAPLRFPVDKHKRLAVANKPVEPVSAITVHQRPDAPKLNRKFDLSMRPSMHGNAPTQPNNFFGRSLIQSQDNIPEAIADDPSATAFPPRLRNMGLEFMDELDAAADASYELDAEDRDVDQEVMDLMELDSQLEQMEAERQRGTKRVFFEEG